MPYTESDLTSVEAAIRELMAGKRRVQLSIGDLTIEYAQANLRELLALKQEIAGETDSARNLPRFFLTTTDKGL